jgi:hypothetical protein
LWWDFLILNNESRTVKVKLHTEQQGNREISNVVDEKPKKFDKNSIILQEGSNISWHHTFLRIKNIFEGVQFLFKCHL